MDKVNKVIGKLTLLVDAKDIRHAGYEDKRQLIEMHIAELERLGVTIADTSLTFNGNDDNLNYASVLVPDIGTPFNGTDVLLLDGNGDVIQGQSDLVINAAFNEVCTATATFVIGGFVTEASNSGGDE
jgi:hypothetical protein